MWRKVFICGSLTGTFNSLNEINVAGTFFWGQITGQNELDKVCFCQMVIKLSGNDTFCKF